MGFPLDGKFSFSFAHFHWFDLDLYDLLLFLIGKYSHDRVLSRFNESKKPRTRVSETIRSFTYSIYSFNIVIEYFSVELIIAESLKL